MELRHLRYFHAVALEGSFTRASERLNIAQPPISRQIRQLELELGAELFVRGTRPLELTPAGRVLFEHAEDILRRVDDISEAVAALGRRYRTLRVGFVGSTIFGALPAALRAFRVARRDIDVQLQEMTTLQQIMALKDGRIVVGLGRLIFDDPAIVQSVLAHEPLALCLPPDETGTGSVDLAALAGRALIVYPKTPRPSYADNVLALLRERGIAPASVVEVGQIQTALGLVAAGVGGCLVPRSAASMRGDIAVRDVADPRVTSPVVASHRAGDVDEPTAALLRTLAAAY